jgi:hypothetical protein
MRRISISPLEQYQYQDSKHSCEKKQSTATHWNKLLLFNISELCLHGCLSSFCSHKALCFDLCPWTSDFAHVSTGMRGLENRMKDEGSRLETDAEKWNTKYVKQVIFR